MMVKVNHLRSEWVGSSTTSRRFFSIFSVLAAFIFFQESCTAPAKNVKHSWVVLDTSRDLECSPWPGVEEMATVSDVVFHQSASREILAAGTGLDRSGKAAMFVSPILKDSPTEAVMSTYKGAPPRLFRGSCPLQGPASGAVSRLEWAIPEKDGCLVLGRDAGDAPAAGMMAPDGQTTLISLGGMGRGFTSGQAVWPGTLEGGSVVIVAEPDLGDATEQKISWVKIVSGNLSNSGLLNIKTTARIESARALPVKEGIFLAAVTGDSLVGDANIEVFFFRFGLSDPVWSKVMKLPHTHLGDPVLVLDGAIGHAVLMVPKWVDVESTIGTYRLSPEGLVPAANQGIFPAASVVADAAEITGGAAAMIRSRTKDKWRYKLCEIKW